MGFSLAEEAASRGGEVVLVAGPVSLKTGHPAIHRVDVTNTSEMLQACLEEIRHTDILIMAAAVADYTVMKPATEKIKKKQETLTISLSQTPDILMELGKYKRPEQFFVGFALETESAMENARKKLKKKSLDLIVLNSMKEKGAGFGGTTNKVTILSASGTVIKGKIKPKREVAKDIVDAILGDSNIN